MDAERSRSWDPWDGPAGAAVCDYCGQAACVGVCPDAGRDAAPRAPRAAPPAGDLPDGLHTEPGWQGLFTRTHAAGALPNGTRLVKRRAEPGDGHAVGVRGTVLGSVKLPTVADGKHLYFVVWDDAPRRAVGVVWWKMAAVAEEAAP